MRMSEAAVTTATTAILAYLRDMAATPAIVEQHILGTGATGTLEGKMRRHFGLPYALAVCNATSALLAAELALGLQKTEIITSPLLYGASLSGALLLGNNCRFADVDESMNLCPGSVRKHVSRRTKAILSTDFNGVPADMLGLRQVADEFGLWLVADAAQSFGARLNGQAPSSTADVVVTSLTCGKPLSAGEGAVLLTRHADVYERLLWYTQHPCRQRRELGLHLFNEFGMNFRIHPLAAVWADAVFDITLAEIADAQTTWLEVIGKLEGQNLIQPLRYDSGKVSPSFFRVLVRSASGTQTAGLCSAALSLGVEAFPFPLNLVYRNSILRLQHRNLLRVGYCEQAEALCRSTILQLSHRQGGDSCKTF